jgi:hypothetical protein
MDSARTSEAYAMLGEIRNREEAYRAEFSQYLSTATAESASAYFPVVDGSGCTEPCPKLATAPNATPPQNWTYLGITPGKSQLTCGYLAISGSNVAGSPEAPPGVLGQELLGSAAIPTPWWYAVAVCDNDGDSTANATFVTAYNTTVVTAQNEHK